MSSLQSDQNNLILEINESISGDIGTKDQLEIKKPVAFPQEYRQELIREFDHESKKEIQEDIQSILDEVKNFEKECLSNAQVLIENAEYRLAHDLLRKVLQKNSYNTQAIQLMGQSLLGMGQTDAAIRCFKSLVKMKEDFGSLSMLAQAYYISEADDQAIEFYFKALEQNLIPEQDLFDVYKNLGNLYTRAGEFELAEEFFNKAYILNPDSDVLLVNFGTLEIQKGQWNIAIERFRSAVLKNIDNDKAWLGLALVHRQFGDHELAWANIEKCLDKNPSNRVAISLLVQWAVKDGKIESTISLLESYLQDNFADEEISLVLAQFLYSVGRLKYSQWELERTINLNPNNETALLLKQQVDLEIRQQGEALDEN